MNQRLLHAAREERESGFAAERAGLAEYQARSSREAEARWRGERIPLEPLQD